jgi:hypothetical protein
VLTIEFSTAPAVDRDRGTGNVAGSFRGHEGDEIGRFLRSAKAPKRHILCPLCLQLDGLQTT